MKHPLYKLAKVTSDLLGAAEFVNDGDSRLATAFVEEISDLQHRVLETKAATGNQVRGLTFAPVVFAELLAKRDDVITNAALASFTAVHWTEFYAEDNWSRDFLPLFANGEGIGPDGTLANNSIILGLYLFGPQMHYPAHAHAAEEFYIVLSGNPQFQIGFNQPFETKQPNSIVVHQSNVSHAIRTQDKPCFGIYGWRGAISERSWYRKNMTDASEPKKFPKIAKS